MSKKNANTNMEFSELIKIRQSVRKYQDKLVEKEKIKKIIEAVRLAPSASNSQPWKLIIVDDPELKDKVADATFSKTIAFNKFVPQAPVITVMVIEKPRLITQIGGRIKNREFPLIDIGIAAEHFCLQAAELGLGTCILGWFNEKKVKELLQVPKTKRVPLLISLGYSEARTRDKTRKSMEEICSWNKY